MMILLKYPLRLGASLIYLIWLYGLWKMVASLYTIVGARWIHRSSLNYGIMVYYGDSPLGIDGIVWKRWFHSVWYRSDCDYYGRWSHV